MTLPTASAPAVLVLGLAAFILLWQARARLSGTTLLAAWWWAVGPFVALLLVLGLIPLVVPNLPPVLYEACYFAAAMTTYCPLMALLGAKRPQQRAWQWIVLSLWVVLSLPAAEWVLYGRTREIHTAQSLFLVGLTALGIVNYAFTRFWMAALLFAMAQWALLNAYLPLWSNFLKRQPHLTMAMLAVALAAARFFMARPPALDARGPDRLWRDFRNLYGALWAARVADRLNVAAHLARWPMWLDWTSGFVGRRGALRSPERSTTVPAPMLDALCNLLRRFVSPEWIAARLDEREAPEEDGGENLAASADRA